MTPYFSKRLTLLSVLYLLKFNPIIWHSFMDKKTWASKPLGNQRAVVQQKNIFACEVMLPKSLSFLEKIWIFLAAMYSREAILVHLCVRKVEIGEIFIFLLAKKLVCPSQTNQSKVFLF